MGNVSLPTPVAIAAGGICILGGYLVGVVTGPERPEQITAVVASYLPDTGRLCLTGASVEDHEGVNEDGRLCGRWRRMETTGAAPEEGEWFRFVAISVGAAQEGGSARGTLIYGDVLR